jgi:hypothetical protein
MTVPETTMHENHRTPCGKYKVWRPRKISPVKPEAESKSMDQFPQE